MQTLASIAVKSFGIRIQGCGEVSIANKNKIEILNKVLIAFENVNDYLCLQKWANSII